METFWDKWFTTQPMGEDVFGAHMPGRELVGDEMNKDLFLQTLRNYVKWQRSNGTFHTDFEKDLKRLQWAN